MDGSISGSVTVQSTRRFVISAVDTSSHGRVHTELDQTLGFSNRRVSTSRRSSTSRTSSRAPASGHHLTRAGKPAPQTTQQQSWPQGPFCGESRKARQVEHPDHRDPPRVRETGSRSRTTGTSALCFGLKPRVTQRHPNFDASGAFQRHQGKERRYLSVDSATAVTAARSSVSPGWSPGATSDPCSSAIRQSQPLGARQPGAACGGMRAGRSQELCIDPAWSRD